MIKTLKISNYALIDELSIEFGEGLSIITGETGAGKSIILGALSLLLGERADVKSISRKDVKTVVEATIAVGDYQLKPFFEENDIDYDNECIVRREITPAGRSRAFINDTPVSLQTLKQLATRLVDIHSQHSNMLLSESRFQLSTLDELGKNGKLLSAYAESYNHFTSLAKQLEIQTQEMQRARAEEDYLRFQYTQLEELRLQPDEDVELEREQSMLSNVAELKEGVSQAESVLTSAEDSVCDQLRLVVQRLSGSTDKLQELQELSQRIESAAIELKDVSRSLFDIEEKLVDDPQRLEQVENRLNDIFAIERKHNVTSVNQLLELQHRFETQLELIDNSDESLRKLTQQVEESRQVMLSHAQALSISRKQAASHFVKDLLPLAKTLGMNHLQFEITFTETQPGNSGIDHVEYCFAFNKNQPLMPIKDTASGGEISRLMLCVKWLLAQSVNLPTIIFDEIDTGVSGDMASRIGTMMQEISNHIQVISITHLPQVVACATTHYLVYKTDDQQSTATHMERLDSQAHIYEVARMLSGKDVDQAAIENAKSLITKAYDR